MTTDITKFGKSSANMKSQFIDELRKRFALNRTDAAEPSDLNAGIIGMMMDMYSNAVEDGYFNTNTRSKEMFVSAAKFDDSLYLHASSCKISDFFATPSSVDILIAIPVKEIIGRAIERSGLGYKMLTLNGRTQFILDRYYYMLDYPVNIVVKTNSTGKSVISCKYDLTNKNSFSNVNATYIPGVIQTLNGVEYYVFKVRAHQIALNSSEFTYTPSSKTSGILEYDFTSQLAGFDVWYKDASEDSWTKIDKVYYGVLSTSSEKFCYYRLRDGKIEIEFSVDPNKWKPELNGRIKVDIYTCEGADGNFNYSSEEIIPYLQQDSSNVYEEAMSGLILACQLATTKSTGGEDMPDMEDIRNKVIDHKASRSTIISETDLERIVGNLGMSISKQRDDIYMRRFATHALIQDDSTGFILPGRTGDLYIPESETENQTEVNSRLVNPNNVYQFWLADDENSDNITRFIAKQPEEIKTSVTIKTDRFKMSVINSHNVELANNSTEKCRMITFNSQVINFENSDDFIVFSGKEAIQAHFNNGTFVGQIVYVRSRTQSVQLEYNDSESVLIIPTHEYKMVWSLAGWQVEDLGVIGKDPTEDGILPTVSTVNMPKGVTTNSEFIFKNHCNDYVKFTYFDYSGNTPVSKEYSLKPNYMLKFTWDGVTWKLTDLGLEGSTLTPTVCLANKDWNNLYSFYTKYNGVLMMCPYMVKIFKNPYFVNLYDVYNNSAVRTVFSYNNNNSPEKFAIGGVNIIRSDIRDNKYTVYCDVSVSDSMYEQFLSLDINEFPMKLKIEMFKDNESYAYFELNSVETIEGVSNKLRFSTILETDNVLHDDDMIRIINRKYSGNAEATNIIPTNDDIYTGSGVIPNTYFIPFKTKLKVHILYQPDPYFENEISDHILDDDERDVGFVITDQFDTEDLTYFVRDVSDVFGSSLEVVKVNGSLPKYPSDVPMKYTEIIYDKNDDGSINVDKNGDFVILHDIGDPVLTESGEQVFAHRAGDDLLQYDANDDVIYEIKPEITYIIKNIPLISMMTMLDDSTKKIAYDALQGITTTIKEKVLPRLVENNSIVADIYNTMGPSVGFVQGSKNSFSQLDNLNVSVEINVKFNSSISDTDSINESVKSSIEDYMRDIVKRGYFYSADLIQYIKDLYPDIDYVEFGNINGLDSSIQTIKSSEEVSATQTPEYITVAQTLDEEAFKLDGTVTLTPNIVVNTIL